MIPALPGHQRPGGYGGSVRIEMASSGPRCGVLRDVGLRLRPLLQPLLQLLSLAPLGLQLPLQVLHLIISYMNIFYSLINFSFLKTVVNPLLCDPRITGLWDFGTSHHCDRFPLPNLLLLDPISRLLLEPFHHLLNLECWFLLRLQFKIKICPTSSF